MAGAGDAGCVNRAMSAGETHCTPALREIVRDGETGVLVAPGDVEALAGALAALRDHRERRERLGAAARVDVRERFAPERLLERVQALYDRVLSSART